MKTLENMILYKERWAIFFSFWLKHIDCGCLLELLHQGSSKEHQQSTLGAKNKENITDYQLKNDIPRAIQGIIALHRYVILM